MPGNDDTPVKYNQIAQQHQYGSYQTILLDNEGVCTIGVGSWQIRPLSAVARTFAQDTSRCNGYL
jgi:hypothetical protein